MYNTENRQVLENLISHRPGTDDGLKIGLVIQGGGLRGAFGAGVAKELTEFGLNENFDVIHASSSGATTAVYLLTGQSQEGTSIYNDFVSRFRFLKPWKISHTMDLEYLIDYLMVKVKPLDIKKVHDSKTLLKVYVTSFESGHSDYFTNHQKVDLLPLLKATCAYPNQYLPVLVNGKMYLDGNIATILPIDQAIQDGCTDILVVTTVPEEHHEPPRKRFVRLLSTIMSRRFTIDFKDVRDHRVDLYNHSLDIAFGREIPDEKVRIYTISPDYIIPNVSIRAKTIRKYVKHGQRKTKEILQSILSVEE